MYVFVIQDNTHPTKHIFGKRLDSSRPISSIKNNLEENEKQENKQTFVLTNSDNYGFLRIVSLNPKTFTSTKDVTKGILSIMIFEMVLC